MDRITDLEETVDGIMALVLIGDIKLKNTMRALEYLSAKAGFSEIEGVPPLDWLRQQEAIQLQKALIQLEDRNPTVAAHMQRIFDENARRNGHGPGEE
jgi:hypothetical protein